MKPLLTYYGGKQRIASAIIPHVVNIPHTVYVEPYCGGAAVFFAKPDWPVKNRQSYREVLNDTNHLLINFYRTAKRYPEELKQRIDETLFSKAEHRRSADMIRNPDGVSDLDLAWAFYTNINQSFSSTLLKDWQRSVTHKHCPNSWNSRKQILPELLKRIEQVYVEDAPALDCIRQWDSPQTLFYIDPPYPGSDQGHYSGFTGDDWAELCGVLNDIRGSFILSGYQQSVEPIHHNKTVIEAYSSASGLVSVRGAREEILWVKRGSISDDLVNSLIDINRAKTEPVQIDLFGS